MFLAAWATSIILYATPSISSVLVLPQVLDGHWTVPRTYGEHRRNFVGQSFWARGYCVSTVGRDEEVIRNYIRNQEEEDRRFGQMNLWR